MGNKKITGQHVAYKRVSTLIQNEGRQLNGQKFDIEFTDKVSGKDSNRPELKRCMDHLRAGDTLHVHSIDRLARSSKDLQNIVNDLVDKGITVQFHKEKLTFNGDDDKYSLLMLSMMGAFAEFELAIINERRREGQQLAKKQGKHIGRKATLDTSHIETVKELWRTGKNKTQIAETLGVSRPSLYKFIKSHSIDLK